MVKSLNLINVPLLLYQPAGEN